MNAISVKELRTKFPFARSELAKGTSFILIHKSKPIGQLLPMKENGNCSYDDEFKDFEKASLEDVNKALGDFLSDEEVKYYMSLPPLP